jgi:SPP1 gp7 family putative phage head morphogenesis protein
VARKKHVKLHPPKGHELAYYSQIRKPLEVAHALVTSKLLPYLRERLDARQPPAKRASKILDVVRKIVERQFPRERLEKIASRAAATTNEFQRKQLGGAMKALTGLDPGSLTRGVRPAVDQFTHENVRLIRSIPGDYLDRVEEVVHGALATGERAKDLASTLEEEFDVSKRRAALIARDQIGKLHANLNRVRQQKLGLTRYVWRTSEDERVREAHAERDGETYSWEDPPGDASDPGDGANPGDGIQCRCSAEPVIDDLLEEQAEDDE